MKGFFTLYGFNPLQTLAKTVIFCERRYFLVYGKIGDGGRDSSRPIVLHNDTKYNIMKQKYKREG